MRLGILFGFRRKIYACIFINTMDGIRKNLPPITLMMIGMDLKINSKSMYLLKNN